jgi:tetratricopeptide (TPR) repeat protein
MSSTSVHHGDLPGRPRAFLVGLALGLLPFVVYAPVLWAGFIWDDNVYVTQNETLRSLPGLFEIWFVPRSIPQYYPLVHTLFWVEYHLWGLDPAGYHVVNVSLHAASAVLLWRVLLRLRMPGAWFAAAVFAVHPVMVESVAWITERKNVLSLSLALAATLSYFRFAPPDRAPDAVLPERRHFAAYFLSLFLFVGALLSKTVVCSLPAVLLVVAWWKRGRVTWRDVQPLVPFLAIGLALGLNTVWLEQHHVGARGSEWALTPLDRVLLAGRVLWFYAAKLIWPHPLMFFYPRWTIDAHAAWHYVFPAAALVVVGGLWLARARIGRGPLAAVLVFAGVLTPALGFFDVYPFRYSYVADHFQYHASIALICAATGLVIGSPSWNWGRARMLGLALVLFVLGGLTLRQVRIYHDLETLSRDTIQRNPGAWQAYSILAEELAAAGRHDEAIQVASQGVAAAPQNPEVHNTLGAMWMLAAGRGAVTSAQLESAIRAFRNALQVEPGYEETLFNLAQALAAAGRHQEAAAYFSRALDAHPEDVESRLGLGRSLLTLGLVENAEAQFLAALHTDPKSAHAHYELGSIARRRGQLGEARDHYAAAAALKPDNAFVRTQLGMVLVELGEPEAALRAFDEALQLAPGDAEAQAHRDRAQALLGSRAAN